MSEEKENKKINSTVLAIALALITSFTSLGTAYITSSNSDKSSVITKENFDNLVKAIKQLDERSLIAYMSLSEEEVKRARDRIEYQKNGRILNDIIKSRDKSVRIPASMDIEVKKDMNPDFLERRLSNNVDVEMKEIK